MAFVACEYIDDLEESENKTTYKKVIRSKLVIECLQQSRFHLDENFMLAVAHLLLKSFIKDELAGESRDPLACFTKL